MIRASGKNSLGVPLLLLGLSGENVTRLVAGEPIRIRSTDLAEMGLPAIDVAIHYGRTEQAIIEEMRANGLLPGAEGG